MAERVGKRRTQRGSRHSKKNMRKKIDLGEIDAFLEDERHDERTGGPVAQRADEQLFFVDGSTKKKDTSAAAEPVRLSRKQRVASKVLYSEANLVFAGGAKPHRTRLPPVKKESQPASESAASENAENDTMDTTTTTAATTATTRTTDTATAMDASNSAANTAAGGRAHISKAMKRKSLLAAAASSDVPLEAAVDEAIGKNLSDPWMEAQEEEEEGEGEENEAEAWVPAPRPLRIPETVGRPLPSQFKRKIPTSMSYNPSEDAHTRAMITQQDREAHRAKRIKRVLKKVPRNVTAEEAEALWMQEMGVGADGKLLYGTDDEDEDGEDGEAQGESAGSLSIGKPVRAEDRKTAAQRARQLKEWRKVGRARSRKTRARRENEIFRLRSLRKEIVSEEAAQQERIEQRLARPARMPRLGPLRAETKEVPVLDSSSLVGSLRELKAQGSTAHVFLNSMVQRNLIEPRARAKVGRKYAPKMYTKRSFKNYDLNESIKADRAARLKAKQDKDA